MRTPDYGFPTYEDQVWYEQVQRMKKERKKINEKLRSERNERCKSNCKQ